MANLFEGQAVPGQGSSNQMQIGSIERLFLNSAVQMENGSTDAPKISTEINRVRQSVANYTETETYKHTLNICQSRERLILHCHGYPGTGKSEIVRKLAKEFPFNLGNNNSLFVKWHIECGDCKHDIMSELQELVKLMHKQFLLPAGCPYQEIIDSLEREVAAPLVDALQKAGIPVLVVLEDVPNKHYKLVSDFLRLVNESQSSVLHVYLAMRKKSSIFEENELKKMINYHNVPVPGFSKKEGMAYLVNGTVDEEEYKYAEKIYNRFSGNPLGLRSAKGFCEKSRINFEDYMEWIEDDDQGMYELEAETISEYGDQAMHIFQAITLPFRPSEDADEKAKLLWNVLCCLSFLHYGRVPRFVIEQFCQHLREEKVRKVRLRNKTDAGLLISKMSDYQLCSVTNEDDVNFHEVVLHAFRVIVSQNADDQQRRLVQTLHVMAGVVTKDMRKGPVIKKMNAVTTHLQALLKRADPLISRKDNLMTTMILSHLHEVLGAIMIRLPQYSDMCEKYLKESKDIIWNVVTQLAEPATNCTNLLNVGNSNSVESVAQRVVKLCYEAGRKLEPGFVTKYQTTITVLRNGEELNFLENKANNKQKFSQFRKLLNGSQSLSQELISLLRESGVFLEEDVEQRVFFAARLASVLHSQSRVVLYTDKPQQIARPNYEWYSTLAHNISFYCRRTHRVGLLSEYLTIMGGTVPILLKCEKHAEQRLDMLENAKRKCEDVLEDRTNVFEEDLHENGLIQEAKGTGHSRILVLRYLVRIYAKIIKLRPNPEQKERGKQYCQQLFELAKENLGKWSISNLSLIYCAKFYCACGEFTTAVDMFSTFFSMTSSSQSHNVYSWAVYNLSRSVLAGGLQMYQQDAIQRCRNVLNSNEIISSDLNIRLTNTLHDLQNL
uniref:Uncharacterized protein LOC100178506 n=1 Tax=Phallusia mammillata TaxID=59560 RepID=A0A6F9DHJ6_9ASCI|nr:uncharacterized protein LOC100178506 [Phallusia mammillata]